MKSLPILSLLLSAACVLAGCGGGVDPDSAVAAANSNNIQRLSNLYLAFQSENGRVGPADDASLKEFIRGLPPNTLTRIGVEPGNVDAIFVSERDGQPFKLRYKVVGSMMGSNEPVVFESEGVDDKKMVGFLNMTQREVDSAEYDSLFAKGSAGAGPSTATPQQ
jgi:hypothetical protein